ncbi:hypothetical protein LJK88_07490 [Paenibacillus sp. P26]|nr:hypothetical protein LJK88_07490 [Paenibacillus sp. P26]UUZ90205.1 hypothetical protein LJK87_30075 [Paenibacillus sp. P25]
MSAGTVYFKDHFLSRGETEITDEQGSVLGVLDLQSMFGSGVTVKDLAGATLYRGQFRFMARGWHVYDRFGQETGVLRAKLAFFKQKYVYSHGSAGDFIIECPAFSREYNVYMSDGKEVAHFRKVSGIFSAGAFELTNRSGLDTEELIVVVMGVHAYIKNQQAAAST